MTTLITQDEVVQCVKQELELTGIADKKHAAPDLSQLLPEVKRTIVEVLLLHTRGNQAQAARMLGMNRATLRKIYKQSLKR
ncbi:helix-turn-helix domain-containing protein [Vibrio owensii]